MTKEIALSEVGLVTLEFNIIQIKVLRKLLTELPYEKVSPLIEAFDKQVLPQLEHIRVELQDKLSQNKPEKEKVDEAEAITDSEN